MLANEDQLKAMMISGLDGDALIYAALLAALVPLLRAFFRRRIPDAADDVEDLVQETLIAVHTRRESYDRDRPFTAWLTAVARYKLIDHFRRRRRLCPIDGLEDILVADSFEDDANARIDVDRLLRDLSEKQQRTIRDTRIEGLSIAETAGRSGMSESDVKVSVYRGLKALTARIVGEHR